MARTAYALLADILRSSLVTLLPARPNRSRVALSGGEAVPDRKELAEAVAREVTAALSNLRECAQLMQDNPPQPRDVNEVVRQAIEIARNTWERTPRSRKGSVELVFEPAPGPLVLNMSAAFVGALVHTIECAVEGLRRGGHIQIWTGREDGQVVVSLRESGYQMIGDRHLPLRLNLAVIQAVARRHGGTASLDAPRGGGALLQIRFPVSEGR